MPHAPYRVFLLLLLLPSCSFDAATITPPDGSAALGAVQDLSVRTGTATTATLNWTAPGNDGAEGQASEYDLRYARDSITDETWDDASRVPDLPTPELPGSDEAFKITGLEPETTYFFGLRVAYQETEWSGLSNIARETTYSLHPIRLTTSMRARGASGPSWSPDGEFIAFHSDWGSPSHHQIYRMRADGTEIVRLTTIDDYAVYPSWSPDGKRIVYVSPWDPPGGWEGSGLWVIESAPDSHPMLLVQHVGHPIQDCTWSPDGTRIVYVDVFVDMMSGSIYRTYLVSAEGGIPVVWTAAGAFGQGAPPGPRMETDSHLAGLGAALVTSG